jgi:hypothetical protein
MNAENFLKVLSDSAMGDSAGVLVIRLSKDAAPPFAAPSLMDAA